ncbi:MAG: hypothetical protein JEZ03_09660, partial [Bacteroidales bacterium]|nr:hypothetical protein [Bacteroidales bacterium]
YESYTETQTITTKQPINSGPSTIIKTSFTFKDIYFIHFDRDGKITWIKEIDKLQTGESDEILSFKHFLHNDMIYVIYNDFTDRHHLKIHKIDCTGSITTPINMKIHSKETLGGYYLVPSSCKQCGEGEFIAYANRFFKTRLVKYKVN